MCAGKDHVVVAGNERNPSIATNQGLFINDLRSNNIDFTYISFGSPYHTFQFPGLENFICTFSSHFESQREVARVLAGLGSVDQPWPVMVPVRLSTFTVD